MTSRKQQPKAQGRGPWCPRCGRTVDRLEASLDPSHPTGVCSWVNKDGILTGHGRVPAVRSSDEIARVLLDTQQSLADRRHAKHLAAAPVAGCPVCARHQAHLAVI